MSRTFAPAFANALAATVDKLRPTPHRLWGVGFTFPSPVGDLRYSSGKLFTSDGKEFNPLIVNVGDISSLTDRREPTRLDIGSTTLEFDNLPGGAFSTRRFSALFSPKLESVVVNIGVYFDVNGNGAGAAGEIFFKGVVQSPVNAGYRTASLTILSLIQKYFSVQALRILTDHDFPWISSATNGKGVPLIFGNVRRAPGRITKEKAWTPPVADIANSTGGSMTEVEIGPAGLTEDITVTFSSSTAFNVVGTASGSLGSGSIDADFVYPLVAMSQNFKLKIPIGAWQGLQASGNKFTFKVDTSTRGEVIFSESPSATPILDLFQLYWNDYAVESGRSAQALRQSGSLTTKIGSSSTASISQAGLDAPIVDIEFVGLAEDYTGYGNHGMPAGQYEYVQTFLTAEGESAPSGTASIDVKDPLMPLPAPSSPPGVELSTIIGGNVTRGTHRWAYTYVSKYGETELGTPSGQFLVEKDFVPPPTVEPTLQVNLPGTLAGVVFENLNASAVSWGFTYVTRHGETTLGPTRSVQVLDGYFGDTIGVTPPPFGGWALPAGAIGVNIYRTRQGITQLDESGTYELARTGTRSYGPFGASGGQEPPTENTSGGPGVVRLFDIAVGPPGTIAKRIYRTTNNDNSPFKFVAQIGNEDTEYLDNRPDTSVEGNSHATGDYREGTSPLLPLDKNLSDDPTNMVATVRVELPKAPAALSPTKQRLYRSKKGKSGTFYFHTQVNWPGANGDNPVILDIKTDAQLGTGLDQTQRPPIAGGAGTIDTLTAHSMRLPITQPILAKSLGIMIAKVGAPTGDVQLRVVTESKSQPTGNTITTATILEADITTALVLIREKINATIIPPGVCWFVVETPNSDADNYYVLALATTVPPGAARYANSQLQSKWIAQGGGLVFTIDGAIFSLDEQTPDRMGFEVAMSKLDVEIPSGTIVSCDTTGLGDDLSGTYTGTPGALITLPGDVVHWVSAGVGKVAEADIDVAGTFALTNAKYGPLYRINGVAQRAQTVQELLLQIGKETRSTIDWSFDKLEWKWIPAVGDVPLNVFKSIRKGDIALDSPGSSDAKPLISIERFGIDGVVNSIDLHWARRAWIESGDNMYARVSHGEDAASVAEYKKLTRTDIFDYDFIDDEPTVLAQIAFNLARLAHPEKLLVKTTLVSPFLDVEKDDLLTFEVGLSPYGEGAFGVDPIVYGGADMLDDLIPVSIFQVEGKTIKPDLMCEFVLREL